jgi:hypothetical protein
MAATVEQVFKNEASELRQQFTKIIGLLEFYEKSFKNQ